MVRLDVKESEIQKSIIEYLRLKKYVVFKHHSTGSTIRDGKAVFFGNGDKGIADIIGCCPDGRFLAIEVKKPGGRATPEQKAFIEKVCSYGGIGLIAFSLEEAVRGIEESRGSSQSAVGNQGTKATE